MNTAALTQHFSRTSAGTIHRSCRIVNGRTETFCNMKTEVTPVAGTEWDAVDSGHACHRCFKDEYRVLAHRAL